MLQRADDEGDGSDKAGRDADGVHAAVGEHFRLGVAGENLAAHAPLPIATYRSLATWRRATRRGLGWGATPRGNSDKADVKGGPTKSVASVLTRGSRHPFDTATRAPNNAAQYVKFGRIRCQFRETNPPCGRCTLIDRRFRNAGASCRRTTS